MKTAFLVKDNLEIEETSFLDVWIKFLNKDNEYVEYSCAEGSDCEYEYYDDEYDDYYSTGTYYDSESCRENHKFNVYLMSSEGYVVEKIAEDVSYGEAFFEEYCFYERRTFSLEHIPDRGIIKAFFSLEGQKRRAFALQRIEDRGIIKIFFSLEEAENFVESQKKEKEEKEEENS